MEGRRVEGRRDRGMEGRRHRGQRDRGIEGKEVGRREGQIADGGRLSSVCFKLYAPR